MDEQKAWLGKGWACPVQLDPATGAIMVAQYETDIRQAIITILRTAPGERVMRPAFGCGINDLVFESINTATITRMQTAITTSLVTYEARIEVLSVDIDPIGAEDGMLLIELQYRIRRTNQVGNLVYPFYFRESGVAIVQGSRG
jgi:phage baseplate assembly protein W